MVKTNYWKVLQSIFKVEVQPSTIKELLVSLEEWCNQLAASLSHKSLESYYLIDIIWIFKLLTFWTCGFIIKFDLQAL